MPGDWPSPVILLLGGLELGWIGVSSQNQLSIGADLETRKKMVRYGKIKNLLLKLTLKRFAKRVCLVMALRRFRLGGPQGSTQAFAGSSPGMSKIQTNSFLLNNDVVSFLVYNMFMFCLFLPCSAFSTMRVSFSNYINLYCYLPYKWR